MKIDVFAVCVLLTSWAGSAAAAALIVGWVRSSECFAWMAGLCAGVALLAFVAGYPLMGCLLTAVSAGYGYLWWTHPRESGGGAS